MGTEIPKELLEEFAPVAEASRNARSFGGQLSTVVAADLTLADLVYKVEGTDKLGYNVRAITESNRRTLFQAYVVKQRGAYRIRTSWSLVSEVGVEGLARLKRGDLVLASAFGGGLTWASVLFRF